MLSWGSTDLTINLIVEVFCERSFLRWVVDIARSCDKLLKLDSGDEVFILGCHQAIAFGEEINLMVTLGTFRIFEQVGLALLL